MTRSGTTAAALAALAGVAGVASAQTGLDLDRAYASEMLADADARASLLGADQVSNISLSVVLQARYMVNLRDQQEGNDLGDDDTTLGFDIPRAQVRMAGVVTDSITGRLSFDFGAAETNGRNTAGSVTLLTAYADWALDDQWSLMVGQWRNPLLAEETVEAEHGLAVERSVVNEFFTPGFTQGVGATHTGDAWKFFGALSDGLTLIGNEEPANSPFNSDAEADFALTARADLLVSGTWDQFEGFTSWRGSNYGLKLGAGAHYQQAGNTNPGSGNLGTLGGLATDRMDVTMWTLDATVQGDGWNVFAAYIGHLIEIELEPTGSVPNLVNHGVVVQGGVFVADQTELFARYDGLFLDSDLTTLGATEEDTVHYATFGVNYYLVPESHAARFTADIVYCFSNTDTLDALSPGIGGTGVFNGPSTTGLLGVSDGEAVFRTQLTLVY